MDKVDFPQGIIEKALNTGNLSPTSLGGARGKDGPRKARGRTGFSVALERSILDIGEMGPLTEVSPSEEAVQKLLDDVQSTGDDLKRRPSPDEILSYKKAVRDFLHYVVENSFELKQSQSVMSKFQNKKSFLQIHVIDQKLEELAAGILTRQINQLDLKNRLDEITGLLVDLTVTGIIPQYK
jgi:uncharacterized protein YaaR (DUF327 family)